MYYQMVNNSPNFLFGEIQAQGWQPLALRQQTDVGYTRRTLVLHCNWGWGHRKQMWEKMKRGILGIEVPFHLLQKFAARAH